jgi:hypothetical protein
VSDDVRASQVSVYWVGTLADETMALNFWAVLVLFLVCCFIFFPSVMRFGSSPKDRS